MPVSLPVTVDGVDELERLIEGAAIAASPAIGIEATGALHRAWSAEVDCRWPDSLRLFAPSETAAARAQLGSRRYGEYPMPLRRYLQDPELAPESEPELGAGRS